MTGVLSLVRFNLWQTSALNISVVQIIETYQQVFKFRFSVFSRPVLPTVTSDSIQSNLFVLGKNLGVIHPILFIGYAIIFMPWFYGHGGFRLDELQYVKSRYRYRYLPTHSSCLLSDWHRRQASVRKGSVAITCKDSWTFPDNHLPTMANFLQWSPFFIQANSAYKIIQNYSFRFLPTTMATSPK